MNLRIKSNSLVLSRFSRILFMLLLTSSIFAFSSCIASRMVPFDLTALNKVTELKSSAVNLMSMATGNYADHTAEIDAFNTQASEHLAYEEARGEKNATTVNMLKLLLKPDGNLMGGFLNKWKTDGKLGDVFIGQIKKEVSDNFQSIIDLENKKKK